MTCTCAFCCIRVAAVRVRLRHIGDRSGYNKQLPWYRGTEFIANTVNDTDTGKETGIFVSLCLILVCVLEASFTMAQLELPLPELLAEDLKQGWTRFEFVATAKEWNEAKQLTVIPTLLRGKLIDYYVELEDEVKNDVKLLKAALEEQAGKKEDPLVASRNFNLHSQTPGERVADFASSLKQLFKSSYPGEALTSAVLLQKFLMGLRPEIGRQLLLHQKPANFNAAVKDAMAIEYALEFGEDDTIHSVGQKQKTGEEVPNTAALLDALTKWLESLEMTIQKGQVKSQPAEDLG